MAEQQPPPKKSQLRPISEGLVKEGAKKVGEKALTKAAATKIGAQAAGKFAGAKAAGAAAGSALGPAGTAVGGFVADKLLNGRNLKKVGGGIVKAAIAPFAVAGMMVAMLFSALGSGIASAGASLAGAIIGIPLFLALVLFIINSGAYITPPSNPLLYSGGDIGDQDGEITAQVGCYKFDNSWSSVPNRQKLIIKAARHILAKPGAEDLICSKSITVRYKPTGLLGGGRSPHPGNIMEIGPKGTTSQTAATYTLAHESGHVIDYRNSFVTELYKTSGVSAEGFLPSYPLGFSLLEDKVESLGLWMFLPTEHSIIVNYQSNYPIHYQFASDVFSH